MGTLLQMTNAADGSSRQLTTRLVDHINQFQYDADNRTESRAIADGDGFRLLNLGANARTLRIGGIITIAEAVHNVRGISNWGDVIQYLESFEGYTGWLRFGAVHMNVWTVKSVSVRMTEQIARTWQAPTIHGLDPLQIQFTMVLLSEHRGLP